MALGPGSLGRFNVIDGGKGGGDDSGGSDMERRVEALEAGFKELRDDVKASRADLHAMRSDMSYIRGKVEAAPTTLQLLGFVAVILVAAGFFKFIGPDAPNGRAPVPASSPTPASSSGPDAP